MFGKIKEFLFGKKKQDTAEVPYKLEPVSAVEPAQTDTASIPCGCGRSSSGFCVGLHKLSVEEWAVHPENKSAIATVIATPASEPVSAPKKKSTRAKVTPKGESAAKKAKTNVAKSSPAAIKAKKPTRKKTSE